ncbi:FecCD family ABC transporter permease [Actinomyces vulturis]|uniref:FecCD family ABC transporter permease n=1 Tax=Actinomyces vulturis TaxID=1857645 RepID=UPI000837086A|nr:iron ABC transporter permease [Actinomyces vulturis]
MALRQHSQARIWLLTIALVAGFVLVCFFSLLWGARNLTATDVLASLRLHAWWNLDNLQASDDPMLHSVVASRIWRTVSAVLSGGALACSGIVMQSMTRNPLADPGVLGINAGAGLTVVFAISAGLTQPSTLLGSAFIGASVACALIWFIQWASRAGSDPLTLVLAGAAVSAGCGAIINALMMTKGQSLDSFLRWMMGSVSGRDLEVIIPSALAIVSGIVLVFAISPMLNGLLLGDDVALGLGIHVPLARFLGSITVVLTAGAATALVGPLAFVGIIVPYILRAWGLRSVHRQLPAGMLLGAMTVTVADIVGRLVAPPGEIPAGVLVAVIGAPLVILAVKRRAQVGI